MKKLLTISLMSPLIAWCQCPSGQSQVTIDVATDNYGYEIYWELVPTGNNCGTGTVFVGGNSAVGCNGGSAQNQTPGGYGNNITVNEGPWCLSTGNSYDLIFVDDWGDGGAAFTINIDGFPLYQWSSATGANAGSVFPFTVNPPLAFDLKAEKISTPGYVNPGNVDVKGQLFNRSANTINSFDLNFQVDANPVVTSNINGLSFAPFTDYNFIHPTPWNVTVNGTYTLKIWASNLNGNPDMDNSNDTIQKVITAGPPIPNIIDNYLGIFPQKSIIANSSDGILVPRDLDFHPTLSNYELWVVLKETEMSGGKTVRISNAGQSGQTSLVQQDGNAMHFMDLPTGIAFSDNENFATSPGVFDANHDGGNPFTGPALWSSDPTLYAQPSGGNGSHLDMLHESPYSMGIAFETENVFWVNDGYNNTVTRYDFGADHGPGNSDHSDGIVRRYSGLGLVEEPTRHVSSHLVLDKTTGWLYIVDTGNDRIVRMDINTGSQTGTFTPFESTAESSIYTGYTSQVYVSSGLNEPSGIDIIGNRMIVSDHSTGEIIVYDISGTSGVELGRIQTATPGIMGVKIGPDGKIWYVNATTNEVVRLETADVTGVEEVAEAEIVLCPNPVSDELNVSPMHFSMNEPVQIFVYDVTGKEIYTNTFSCKNFKLNVLQWSKGLYSIRLVQAKKAVTKKVIVE